MYSVVVLMALGGSADMPAFGRNKGCDGGCGGRSGFLGGRRDRGGCNGGSSCYGGYGGSSCHGGGYGGSSCHGGGYGGGCHGGVVYTHSGGSCVGGSGHVGYSGGCHGGVIHHGQVGHGCVGGHGQVGHGGIIHHGCVGGHMQGAPMQGEPKKMPEASLNVPAPATVVVTLPAEATLTVDGNVTRSTSDRRVFQSPELTPGRDFHYTLQAEIVRDGQKQVVKEIVTVRAGGQTTVNLTFPATASTVANR